MSQATANPGSGAYAENVRVVRGQYGYLAGTSGTVSVPATGALLSWAAFATAAGATVTINAGAGAGNSIPVPQGGSVGGEAHGTVVAPAFVFTGTAGYFIEYVT